MKLTSNDRHQTFHFLPTLWLSSFPLDALYLGLGHQQHRTTPPVIQARIHKLVSFFLSSSSTLQISQPSSWLPSGLQVSNAPQQGSLEDQAGPNFMALFTKSKKSAEAGNFMLTSLAYFTG